VIEERYRSTRMRLLGLVYLAVAALFLSVTVAIYQGAFADEVRVTLHTDRVGNQMQVESDVKVRGVLVGAVRDVRTGGEGAELVLALKPDKVDMIPRNVTARLLPKTLFGERYVSLVMPPRRDGSHLSTGDIIRQDRSPMAIELERVLDNLLPLLQAVQPEKLSSTLSSLAQALDGRGRTIGETVVLVNNYLGELNPSVPKMREDISDFATAADTYDESAVDFIQSLSDFTVTSKTILDHQKTLQTLFPTVTASARDLTKFLERNGNTMIRLGDASRETLALLAKYAPSYACTLRALADFKPKMDRVLGKGTDEPGIHASLVVVPPRGKYVSPADDPQYGDKSGPQCPTVPLGPERINDGSTAGDYSAGSPVLPVSLGLSTFDESANLANSTEEREFLSAVLAPSLGVRPDAVPAWSSMLVAPVFRGAEVSFL
jgi:phospholipid/cholesterol/gamma-HCH transport system substrate-binding protein